MTKTTWPTVPGSRPRDDSHDAIKQRIILGRVSTELVHWDEAGVLERRRKQDERTIQVGE